MMRASLLILVLLAGACATASATGPRSLTGAERDRLRLVKRAVLSGDPRADLLVGELLSRDPRSVDALRLRQILRFGRGEDWQVYEEARARHEAHPGDPVAAYLLARVIPDRGRQAEMLREVVRDAPDFYFARLGLAVVALERRDAGEALVASAAAVRLRPSSSDARLVRARALYRADRRKEAEEMFRLLLAGEPGHRGALEAAAFLRRDGRPDEALDVLLRALSVEPARARFLLAVARLLDLGAGTGRAVDRASEAAWADRGNGRTGAAAHVLRARVFERRGRPASALASLTEAIAAVASARGLRDDRLSLAVRASDYAVAAEVLGEGIDPPVLGLLDGSPPPATEALTRAFSAASGRPADADVMAGLARALSAAGYGDLASIAAARAASRAPERADLQILLSDLVAWERFLADVRAAFGRGYLGHGRSESVRGLDRVLARLSDLSRRRLGKDVLAGLDRLSYPLVGVVARSDRCTAAAEWERRGTLLVLGRRAGGPPEAVMVRVVARTRAVRPDGKEYDVTLGEGASQKSWLEAEGANIAGFALPDWVFLNLDVVNRWEEGIARRAERAVERPLWPAPDEERRLSLWFPNGVRDRLAKRYLEGGECGRGSLVSSLVHEEGHVLDVERYYPLAANFPRVLFEVVRHGFSAAAMEARLEQVAETHSLRTSPFPRAALQNTLSFLPDAGSAPPHSVGYHEIAEDLIRELDASPDRYPSIDRRYNLLQQLDRLADEELRLLLDSALD